MTEKSRWEPACSMQAMADRAKLNANIRRFFADREVMEVETPLLGSCSVTDPALHAFKTSFHLPGQEIGQPLFLQTSPEFAMKRLLAAGSGSIYQICKAFRNEESGRHHNPEFTLLEWYRLGYTLDDLMSEIESLVAEIAPDDFVLYPPERVTYVEAFSRHLAIHPVDATIDALADIAVARNIPEARELCRDDRAVWLDLLFSCFVQPFLGQGRLTSIYRYPAFMPSLARTCPDDERFVGRVEIFLSGIELGNGFYELNNAEEQKARFQRDRQQREAHGLPVPDMDERLLSALRQGLPDCSGMAIGLDRLLMAFTRRHSLSEVLAFPVGQS